MKKFLRQTLIVFAPLILGLVLVEGYNRIVENEYSYKDQWVKEHAKEIRWVALGNSHAYYGIEPSKMEAGGFNLALPGQSVYLDYLLFEHYNPVLENLETIVVNVSYASFYRNHGVAKWRRPYYYHKMGIDSDSMGFYSVSKLCMSCGLGFKPAVKPVLQKLKGKSNVLCNEDGSFKKKEQETGNLEGEGNLERHLSESGKGSNQRAIYQMLSELALESGVQIIFVKLPKSQSYLKGLPEEKVKAMDNFISDLVSSNNGFSYLNACDSLGLDDSHFSDIDHMNSKGAEVFSTWLDAYL